MITIPKKALVTWFKSNIARGCSAKEMKELALKAGHSQSDVDSAFSSARRVTGHVSVPSAFPLHLIALGAVLTLGLITSYYVLFMMPAAAPSEGLDPTSVGTIAFGKAAFKTTESLAPLVIFGIVLVSMIGLLYYRLYVHPIPGMPPGL